MRMPSGRNIFLGLQITGAVRYTTGAGLGLVYPNLVLADPFLGHDIDLLHEPRLYLLLLLPLVLYLYHSFWSPELNYTKFNTLYSNAM